MLIDLLYSHFEKQNRVINNTINGAKVLTFFMIFVTPDYIACRINTTKVFRLIF